MSKFMRFEDTIAALAMIVVVLSAIRVYAIECNGQQPHLGNCGMEDRCEVRSSESICTGTYGDYYQDHDGIFCASGERHNHCIKDMGQPPGDFMKCTCEYFCDWDPETGKCSQGMPHTLSDSE